MTEARQAKFEDSNIAKLGSYEDMQARLNAAKTEKEWQGAGAAVGLEVWRVYNFGVHKVPKEQSNQFYGGDSYIVLNTYKSGTDKFGYDVHFWLGKESSQDERGTAAYKTVELDDLLGTLPHQHREVQGRESQMFLSYFHPTLKLLNGGMPSAFKHTAATVYPTRLLHIKQVGKLIKVVEVTLSHKSLNSYDVFLVDAGLKLFVWCGNKCSGTERYKGNTVAEGIQAERGDHPVITHLSQDDDNADFWAAVGGKGPVADKDTDPSAAAPPPRPNVVKVSRLSDRLGTLKVEEVHKGAAPVPKRLLDKDDVFIVDTPETIFVWVGSGASVPERRNAMKYASDYILHHVEDKAIPISRVIEGQEPHWFTTFFH
jgi:gelsolin